MPRSPRSLLLAICAALAAVLAAPPVAAGSGCEDADGDGLCVASDCDDTLAECTTACVDGDGDGVPLCGGDCEEISSQIEPIRLNGDLSQGAYVPSFKVSRDGQRVVYQVSDAGLQSVPVTGGTSVRLDVGLQGGYASLFQIDALTQRVVFLYSLPNFVNDLYSVPIDGGSPILLAAGVRTQFEITADGSSVVYIVGQPGVPYVKPIGGGSAVQLYSGSGNVASFLLAPDGVSAILVVTSISPVPQAWLYRVDFEGSAPGPAVGSCAMCNMSWVAISPDTDWIVYQTLRSSTPHDYCMFSRGIGGTGSVNYSCANQSFDPNGAAFPLFTSEPVAGRTRMIYQPPGVNSVWSTALDGTENAMLASTTSRYILVERAGRVAYYASGNLHTVPILGGGSTVISGPFVAGGAVASLATSRDGSRLVFHADRDVDEEFEIYSVPTLGGATQQLNAPLPPSGDVSSFAIDPAGGIVVYRGDQEGDERQEIYAVPIEGGPPRKLNNPPTGLDGGVLEDFLVTPDGTRVVYRQAEQAGGPAELYSVVLDTDADADGTVDSCDCDSGDVQLPGEARDVRVFHEGGVAGSTKIGWTSPAAPGGLDVVYDLLRTDVKDGFAAGSSAPITCVETNGSDFTANDATTPAGAFFYLVRAGNACGEGLVGDGRERAEAAVCP